MSKSKNNDKQMRKIARTILPMMEDMQANGPEIPQHVLEKLQKEIQGVFAEKAAKKNGRLKAKAKAANVIAKTTHFLVDWQPFNLKPVRAVYNWSDRVRSNDPSWSDYLAKKEAKKQAKKAKKAEKQTAPIAEPVAQAA